MTRRGMPNESEDNVVPGHPHQPPLQSPRRLSKESSHVNHFAISDPVALRILQNTFKIADARQRHFAEERELWASVEREIPLHRRSISCPGTERLGSKGQPAAAQGVQETLQGLQDSKDSGVADRHIFELQAEIKTLRRENQILQQKNQLPDSFVQASARKVSSQPLQGSAAIDPIVNGHALPVRRVEAVSTSTKVACGDDHHGFFKEHRIAPDGHSYNHAFFIDHFGGPQGSVLWSKAQLAPPTWFNKAPQDYDMDKMDQLTAALAVEQGADLTGTWFYEDGEKSYEIRRDTGGLLKFIEASAGVGVLKKTHIGNKGYMVAALPHGTLRLRCRGQQIVSNFRPEGDARWGTDVIATKVTPHNDCSTEPAGLVGSTYDSAAIRRRKLQRDAGARNGSSVAHQVDDYSQAPNGLALKSAAASNGHGDPALADQLEQLDRFVKELQVCFKQGAPNLQR